MPNEKFVKGLKDLDYEVEILTETRVAILYTPFDGRLKGQVLKVGFDVPPDFELTPPTGPHISPCFLTINEGAPNHPDRVAHSPFGEQWQYLSRPFKTQQGEWNKSQRTVKVYIRFVEDVLNTL